MAVLTIITLVFLVIYSGSQHTKAEKRHSEEIARLRYELSPEGKAEAKRKEEEHKRREEAAWQAIQEKVKAEAANHRKGTEKYIDDEGKELFFNLHTGKATYLDMKFTLRETVGDVFKFGDGFYNELYIYDGTEGYSAKIMAHAGSNKPNYLWKKFNGLTKV